MEMRLFLRLLKHLFAAVLVTFISSSCRLTSGSPSSSHLTMDPQKHSSLGEGSWIQDSSRLPTESEIVSHISSKLHSYYMVTEFDPKVLKDYLKTLNKKSQVQIVVGSERGFLTSVSDYLVLADSDPYVQLYNHINRALLKLSKDHDSYLDMRFAQSFDKWNRFFGNGRDNFGLNKKIYFDFWTYTQAFNENKMLNGGTDLLKFFFKKNNITSNLPMFPLVDSYIENSDNYLHLKKLADQNRIIIKNLDFTSPEQVEKLIDEINGKNTKIGIVDVSNIFQYILKNQNARDGYIKSLRHFNTGHIVMTFLNERFSRLNLNGKPFIKFFHYFVLDPFVSVADFLGKPINMASLTQDQVLVKIKRPNCSAP